MKRLAVFLSSFVLCTNAFAVDDCDIAAATGIASAIINEQTNVNKPLADALKKRGGDCLKYPDLFAQNVSLPTLSNSTVVVEWDAVRRLMALGNTAPGTLVDVKENPAYQEVYGLLLTEGPWWSWGAATIGGVVGAGICIATMGAGCLGFAGAGAFYGTGLALGAGATAAGVGGGAIVSQFYQMDNGEMIGNLPKWQSDWRGCFNLCGKSADTNDLLTLKVLRPVLGGTDKYCIDGGFYYNLVNMTTKTPVFFTKDQADKVASLLPSIADQGRCDGHFNDVDAYIIRYDVDSVSVNAEGKEEMNFTISTASEPIRLDD